MSYALLVDMQKTSYLAEVKKRTLPFMSSILDL